MVLSYVYIYIESGLIFQAAIYMGCFSLDQLIEVLKNLLLISVGCRQGLFGWVWINGDTYPISFI